MIGFPILSFADDGHLRALGIANLAGVLLPVISILLLLFIIAAVDRFTTPNLTSSKILKVFSWILITLLGLILLMIGFQSFLALWVSIVLAVILLVLYLDFKLKIKSKQED